MDQVGRQQASLSSADTRKGKPKKKQAIKVLEPPPCYSVLQTWRDNSRDWLCRLYAFAVPTEAALRKVAAMNLSIIEVGAGTGYWAYLLRAVSKKYDNSLTVVYPYDVHPKETNEYHGNVFPYTQVEEVGITAIAHY